MKIVLSEGKFVTFEWGPRYKPSTSQRAGVIPAATRLQYYSVSSPNRKRSLKAQPGLFVASFCPIDPANLGALPKLRGVDYEAYRTGRRLTS
jgi:hypothetical protein